jgi:hypothetical protein
MSAAQQLANVTIDQNLVQNMPALIALLTQMQGVVVQQENTILAQDNTIQTNSLILLSSNKTL